MEFKVLGTGKPEPLFDMVRCLECGFTAYCDEFETYQDGDWETGYYTVHACHHCGPDVEGEYDEYSPEQMDIYNQWYDEQRQWEQRQWEQRLWEQRLWEDEQYRRRQEEQK